MVTRIVKMVFQKESIDNFLSFFNEKRNTIRAFEGCTGLELWQDISQPSIFFTYSKWDSEEHLQAYRQSPFFAITWTQTKKMFAAKAEAWTVSSI